MKTAALTALLGIGIAFQPSLCRSDDPAAAEKPTSAESATTDAKATEAKPAEAKPASPPALIVPEEKSGARKPAPGADASLETVNAEPAKSGANSIPPGSVGAATASETKTTTGDGDLRKQISDLQKQVEGLQTTLQAIEMRVRKDAESSVEEQKKLMDAVDLAQRGVVSMNDDIAKLRDSLKSLTANVERNNAEIAKILEQGSSPTTVTARRPVEDLADESKKLKRDVIRTMQGRLLLRNSDPAAEKMVYVNGTPWRARVGRSYLWVPLGHVSVGIGGKDPQLRSDWVLNPTTGVMELTVEF